jgi:hypothetical protein
VTGQHLELLTVPGTRAYPVLSARAVAGATQWDLKIGTHVMRSQSSAGEPTYIFSSVVDNKPDLFYCVIFQRSEFTPTWAHLHEHMGSQSARGSCPSRTTTKGVCIITIVHQELVSSSHAGVLGRCTVRSPDVGRTTVHTRYVCRVGSLNP